jgi:hypothetical protein
MRTPRKYAEQVFVTLGEASANKVQFALPVGMNHLACRDGHTKVRRGAPCRIGLLNQSMSIFCFGLHGNVLLCQPEFPISSLLLREKPYPRRPRESSSD